MARELRKQVARHARHARRRIAMPAARPGSARNPIVVDDMPPEVARSKKPKKKDISRARDAQGRFIKADTVTKPKATKKVVKTKAAPQKPVRPARIECVICAATKSTRRSFKAADVVDSCRHFENVCDLCIQKQVRMKMTARELTDAHLPCLFPECEAVLDYDILGKILPKALFESWDTAIVKHLLAADASYVACLNPKCGVYFSTEGCESKREASSSKSKSKSRSKKTKANTDKSACPHCDYEICLSCNRPWHSGSCDSVRRREDKQSEQTIKKLGAKPCPNCGVNIEKQGGCDHMRCKRCHHNFCWECLGGYTGSTDPHAETCSHRRPMIAHDAGNFVDGNLTDAEINALIERAQQDRDAGREPPRLNPGGQRQGGVQRPGALHLPGPPTAPAPGGAMRAANAPAPRRITLGPGQTLPPPGRPADQGQQADHPSLLNARVLRPPPLPPGMFERMLNDLLGGGQLRWLW